MSFPNKKGDIDAKGISIFAVCLVISIGPVRIDFCLSAFGQSQRVIAQPTPFFLRIASSCQLMSNHLSLSLLGSMWHGQSPQKHVSSLAAQPRTIHLCRNHRRLSMYFLKALPYVKGLFPGDTDNHIL